MSARYPMSRRMLAFVVLFFFTWTFGGVFDIAYAAQSSSQSQNKNPNKPAGKKTEEKLS